MITRCSSRILWRVSAALFVFQLVILGCRAAEGEAPDRYAYRQEHDPNGSGKFYLGREIALVMGHQGADWLERAEREAEEKPELLIEALKLKIGDRVADIGAGTGYLARRLATRVGQPGTVYAVEIQPEMLVILTNKMAQLGITNVKPVLGTITDPKLPPASVDLVTVALNIYSFYRRWQPGFRARRRQVFLDAVRPSPTTTILDVGGNYYDWENLSFAPP
ncbi:MAG: class I SAM-dependent methyltransferase, partial [Verrucomicrobiota bacterium]